MRITFDLELRKSKSELELVMELRGLHPSLWMIYSFAALYAWLRWREDLIITSMLRPGDAGVHAYGRGMDIDVDEKAGYQGLAPANARELADAINAAFEYDPSRPEYRVAVYGAADSSGRHWNHIHLQAHARTMPLRTELIA